MTSPVFADEPMPPTLEGASTTKSKSSVSAPPPLPEPALEEDDSRNLPKTEITTIVREEMIIEEHRYNGKLLYAKITPSSGPAYYLIDRNGDGFLEKGQLGSLPPVNEWILFEW